MEPWIHMGAMHDYRTQPYDCADSACETYEWDGGSRCQVVFRPPSPTSGGFFMLRILVSPCRGRFLDLRVDLTSDQKHHPAPIEPQHQNDDAGDGSIDLVVIAVIIDIQLETERNNEPHRH